MGEARRLAVSSLGVVVLAAVVIAGCGTSPPATPLRTPASANPTAANPRDQAAAEATAIIQRAEATALVMQAQAKASALVQAAGNPAPAPAATAVPLAIVQPAAAAAATPVVAASSPAAQPSPAATVEIIGVGYAGDGAMIMVQFYAPPLVARDWWQGSVYVLDEAKGTKYDAIPVMPIIGPLIGRPKEEGQLGYVMLVNGPTVLQPGTLVTVVLGDYRKEHVEAKWQQ